MSEITEDDILEIWKWLETQRGVAQNHMEVWRLNRRKHFETWREAGFADSKLATILGISRQRISQIRRGVE